MAGLVRLDTHNSVIQIRAILTMSDQCLYLINDLLPERTEFFLPNPVFILGDLNIRDGTDYISWPCCLRRIWVGTIHDNRLSSPILHQEHRESAQSVVQTAQPQALAASWHRLHEMQQHGRCKTNKIVVYHSIERREAVQHQTCLWDTKLVQHITYAEVGTYLQHCHDIMYKQRKNACAFWDAWSKVHCTTVALSTMIGFRFAPKYHQYGWHESRAVVQHTNKQALK